MRLVLVGLLLSFASNTAAQTAPPNAPLQLRWELKQDVFEGGRGASRVAFTLTNRDARPLPGSGWAIYFNALHEPQRDSVSGGFRIEEVTGGFLRLVPGPAFAGLAPGQSVEVEYRTGLLTNRSFAPTSPYIVFDDAKDVGRPLDYVALPFERLPQGPGRDPRAVTPEAQYALDSAIRDIPAAELPLVFPTPFSAARGGGEPRPPAVPASEAGDQRQEGGRRPGAAGRAAPRLAEAGRAPAHRAAGGQQRAGGGGAGRHRLHGREGDGHGASGGRRHAQLAVRVRAEAAQAGRGPQPLLLGAAEAEEARRTVAAAVVDQAGEAAAPSELDPDRAPAGLDHRLDSGLEVPDRSHPGPVLIAQRQMKEHIDMK